MSFKKCKKCGGKKKVFKTDPTSHDIVVRSRKCEKCGDISRTQEIDQNDKVYSGHEKNLVRDYREMSGLYRSALHGFIRFLKELKQEI